MRRPALRKLEETSWLAQIVRDRMAACNDSGNITKASMYSVLLSVIHEAENPEAEDVYFDTYGGRRGIIICRLRSMDGCEREYLERVLRGIGERYKDVDGDYIVSVVTTHDLNHAYIKSISGLLEEMSINA